jgi:hypothetical protein
MPIVLLAEAFLQLEQAITATLEQQFLMCKALGQLVLGHQAKRQQ